MVSDQVVSIQIAHLSVFARESSEHIDSVVAFPNEQTSSHAESGGVISTLGSSVSEVVSTFASETSKTGADHQTSSLLYQLKLT